VTEVGAFLRYMLEETQDIVAGPRVSIGSSDRLPGLNLVVEPLLMGFA
jgi:hypothetical protein